MILGVCKDRKEGSKTYGIEGEFFFSSLYELLASLHVICNPGHHVHRQKWWNTIKEEIDQAMMERIIRLGSVTEDWLITMDFCDQMPYIVMDIEECFLELDKIKLENWNEIFIPYQKKCNQSQKNEIICLWKNYYEKHFQKELCFLKPLLIRELEKEFAIWKADGFERSIDSLHDRLKVEEKELIFLKNKEYHFPYQKITKIQLTATTFVGPHLLMGEREYGLSLARLCYAEKNEMRPPEELFYLHYALSDETRLRMLRILRRRASTTKQLSDKLTISPAAVSKQLKVLYQAKLVRKKRQGNGVYYILQPGELDFLTYRIYEYLG